MHRLPSVVGGTVTALLLTCLAAPPAVADDDGSRGPDNVVRAYASGEGRTVAERSSVVVTTADGDAVDNQNVAEAYASNCRGCRAIAVAFQAVLVPGRPTSQAPVNVAAAVNDTCNACTTAAFAYQYVVRTDGVRRLDEDGQERVERVAEKVARVTRSGLTPAEIDQRLDALELEFRAAVDAGLASEGAGEDDDDEDDDSGDD